MSDEERDKHARPREDEAGHEWLQRQTSTELRWLDLFERLTVRVETYEKRLEAYEEESRRRAEAYEEESRRRHERMEGKIEFILGQQAQFTADMQQLRESQARSEERWERAARMWAPTEESARALLKLAERHDEEINRLRESQAQTDRQMRETDDRINALVNAVEALVSERRNGGGAEAREG